MADTSKFTFPFAVDPGGRARAVSDAEAIRGKIVQVLFTTPGERVNQPEFGCGLFNLVFEPNNSVLAAAMEFTVAEALDRWLDHDILVDSVTVEPEEERAMVQIVYTRKRDLVQQALRIRFR